MHNEQSAQQTSQPAGSVYATQEVKYRNMFLQAVIFVFTLGIYFFYWFYVTAREMQFLTQDRDASPALWTILLFVPFADLYAVYKWSQLYEKLTNGSINRWLMWLLFIVFLPVVWLIAQPELNRRATVNRPS